MIKAWWKPKRKVVVELTADAEMRQALASLPRIASALDRIATRFEADAKSFEEMIGAKGDLPR